MTEIPPEVWQSIAQTGGTPLLVLLGIKFLWNGTGKRIQNVEDRVQKIHDAIVRLEARFEAEDRKD